MTDKKRCEPPPELRDRDGWHWVQYKQSPMCRAEWSATEREWFFPEDQTHSPVESLSTSWRYFAPVTPPATVAALAEALKHADLQLEYIDQRSPSGTTPAVRAQIGAALALYREAGR